MILRTELKLVLREPVPLAFMLGLPLILLLAFGLAEPSGDLDNELASLAVALSFAMLALFMLPGYMTDYRARGVLRRLSTTPVHPARLLTAQLVIQGAFALASVPLVLALGAALGMAMPAAPLTLVGVLLLGGAALFSLGLLVAALAPDARTAWVFEALLFFPSLFMAGVYLPREQMPGWLARIGDFTPLGAFRVSVEDAWTGAAPDPLLLAALAVTAAAVGTLAARVFRWE